MSSPQSKLARGNHVIVSTYDVIDRLTVEVTRDNISPASPRVVLLHIDAWTVMPEVIIIMGGVYISLEIVFGSNKTGSV